MHSSVLMNALIGIWLLAVIGASSWALPSDYYCPSDRHGSLCSFIRPLIDDSGKVVNIPYKFFYRPPVEGEPTVVVVPGGPGSGSIYKDDSHQSLKNIPHEFGLILTDPLFVGQNSSFSLALPNGAENNFHNAISSEQVAADIEMAIKTVAPNKIIVYAQSYGTVPGTILASHLPPENTTLILDGTWSRAFSQKEYNDGFFNQWKMASERLGPEKMRLFTEAIKEFESPYHNSMFSDRLMPARVGDAIQVAIMLGTLEAMLSNPSEGWILTMADAFDHSPNFFGDLIGCREMTPDGVTSSEFIFDRELKAIEGSNCVAILKGLPLRLYDAQKYPVKSAIIYLSGESDAAAPPWMVKDHAVREPFAQKYFVSVPNGSHISLERDLVKCAGDFWHALKSSPKAGVAALQPCIDARK